MSFYISPLGSKRIPQKSDLCLPKITYGQTGSLLAGSPLERTGCPLERTEREKIPSLLRSSEHSARSSGQRGVFSPLVTATAAKKRGPSRSLHLVKLFESNGKIPLPIEFDTQEGTYLPTGDNQKYVSRVVGTRVRQFVHPNFDRWANVPEEQKARATGCVYEYFDVNPSRYSNADYKLIVDGIEDIAARRYRQYKSDVNAYIRDKGTAVPYRGLTTEVWEKCIERSSSQKFKRDSQTQEWPSVIETFKVNHQRNGEWVNERAASDYEKMVEEREEQTQQASSSSVAVNENDVVLKVLGERRGHRRAVGRVLRGTSRSHSSTTRLRDQQSTSESIQATNALKSKMET
ncbi:Uncharacterized protein Adt_48330 [Abeliophyllum distichum]|uniref:Uncharacterized protein n=1 Tax=Abeliophyllum distichum TaxID=126358 RepID=A0ABD1NRA9_9LAMI